MQWWSEAAVVWLPPGQRPYPDDFAQRAAPGTSDFYYYALDAFAAVKQRLATSEDVEPWVYLLEDSTLLSPPDIRGLLPEWENVRSQASLPAAAAPGRA